MAGFWRIRTEAMQNSAIVLPRTPLPRTRMNRARYKDRGCLEPRPVTVLTRVSCQAVADVDHPAFALRRRQGFGLLVEDLGEAPDRQEHAEARVEEEVAAGYDQQQIPASELRGM